MRIVLIFAITLSSILFSTRAMAVEAKVRFNRSNYTLKLGKDVVDFREEGFARKIERKKCNKTVFDLFAKQWQRNVDLLVDIKKPEKLKGVVRVSIDKKEKYALRVTKTGEYFMSLPSLVKNLWFTSERLCRK